MGLERGGQYEAQSYDNPHIMLNELNEVQRFALMNTCHVVRREYLMTWPLKNIVNLFFIVLDAQKY